MPAKAYRGTADRVDIYTAAAPVTGSVPVVEDGWAGFPVFSAAAGEDYVLHVEGEFEIDFINTSVVGTVVYITAASGALSLTAGSGKREFGKVTRIQGQLGTATGKMWIKISPYVSATTTP